MGLIAYVYRNGPQGQLNAISADRVCIVNIEGPFEPTENCPAVELVAGHLYGTARIVVAGDRHRGSMGGAYVATSDSRFNQAVEKITGGYFYGAVALHDRFE
jgi:hypothetical protein